MASSPPPQIATGPDPRAQAIEERYRKSEVTSKPPGGGVRTFLLLVLFMGSMGLVGYVLWSQGVFEGMIAGIEEAAEEIGAQIGGPFAYSGTASFGALDSFRDPNVRPEALLVSPPPDEVLSLLWQQTAVVNELVVSTAAMAKPVATLPPLTLPEPASNGRGEMRAVTYRKYQDMAARLTEGEVLKQVDDMLAEMRTDLATFESRVQNNPASDPVLVNADKLSGEWIIDAISDVLRYRDRLRALGLTRSQDRFTNARRNWQDFALDGAGRLQTWVDANTLAQQTVSGAGAFSLVADNAMPLVRVRLRNGTYVYLLAEGAIEELELLPRLRISSLSRVSVPEEAVAVSP